jgi:nuclear pore complex protein Nup98-Nup96
VSTCPSSFYSVGCWIRQRDESLTGCTGFGAAANNNTFGATNTSTGGGLFGGGGSTGSFGAGAAGGFGQTNSAFGTPKTTFGASTATPGGGLFGASTTATTGNTGGFGGFGQTNTAATSSPFGGGGGSSLFGGVNKPATGFGSTTTPAAGNSLFGGGAATNTGGFGATGTAFGGATNNPGLGAVGDPPGTAQVPFSPTNEKETSNPSQTNSYQSILFQEPYKKWSAEELRLADYNQGRRHGNATGAGAFGVSSGFGSTGFGTNTTTGTTGFGATNTGTGLFGQSQPATGGFGQTATNTTGGFGASTGGGLFGAAKPAGTGLFGSTATQPAQTTGLFGGSGTTGFGSTANTGTGFGATTNNTTGGGLFGNTASQPKPAGFSFGNTGTTTGGFGATNTTGGFGANTNTPAAGGSLFGATNTQQPAAGGGLFGNTQQQNTTTGFGASGGFGQQNNAGGNSLFNQAKPAGTGLFGNTNTTATTGGGLFGNATANTSSNPFGGATNNNQTQSGGLFGNKPATTGGGLFGNTTQQAGTTGGGLFGGLGANTQAQQPAAGGGLFGGLGQTQQQKPSPFGSTLGQSTGGGLFGGQNNQQSGGMFGNSNQQQQQQQGGLGGSMFGGSQNNQQPQSLSTNINDLSAYGSTSLFTGLGGNEAQNPGPLATPLNGNKNKVKSRSILPMYKLSPANASRFVTPQKRGFGFSYSTYGTPSSASSVSSTPGGLGQSLLMGSTNRGLAKSISTSSLRRSFNVEDSILAPGSFSASSGPRYTGGHKKLIINKDMRSDLFTSPNKNQAQDANGARKLTKRVSFDTSTNKAIENGNQASESNTPDESSDTRDLGYIRPATRQTNGTNGAKPAAPSDTPEMEQVKGKELAIVHEEETAAAPARSSPAAGEHEPGEYWMSPPKEEILAMNRVQRQKVENFAVGRENVGSVSFKVPVDLSNIDLDELYGNIVILEPRSATVYPVAAKKPQVGKGLNVPATISLEQSWPRARDKRTPLQDKTGSRIAKHIERLKRIENTAFESYDAEHGIWTFSVEHFTTYGLDDDDDEEETEADVAPPVTSTTKTVQARASPLANAASPDVDPDDTFEFKRSRRAVPGAFDDGTALSDDEEMGDSDHDQLQRLPSAEPEMAEMREEYDAPRDDESMAEGYEEGRELVRVPSSAGESVQEQEDGGYQLPRSVDNDPQVPAGIMRARMRAIKKSTAPTKIQVAGGDDWTQILQQSVRAPRTVDRATLRALNESGAAWDNLEQRGSPAPKQQSAADTAGFATSIDLMKSLFAESKGPAQSVQGMAGKGFVKVGV